MSGKPWLPAYGERIPSEIDAQAYGSVVEMLEAAMKRYAEKPAFRCLGQTLTYAESQLRGGNLVAQRLHHCVAPALVLAAQRRQMRVDRAVLDQIADHHLRQVLGVRIGLLFDERKLLDDRRSCADPPEPQPRCEHFRKTIQVNHERVLVVELVQ